MHLPYRSFLGTTPFTIHGPNGKSFFAHSALVANHSKVLDRDVNGGMREANDKVIEIADVNGDINDGTVMRFIEYAYTGDYTVPKPEESDGEGYSLDESDAFPSESLPKAATPEPEVNSWPSSSLKNSARSNKKQKEKSAMNWAMVPAPLSWDESSSRHRHQTIAQRKQDLWHKFVTGATLRTSNAWEPRRPEHPPKMEPSAAEEPEIELSAVAEEPELLEEPLEEPRSPEPELPWDFGLNSKQKKKKRKEMEAQGIIFDTFGDPIYREPEPEVCVESELEPVSEVEAESVLERASSTNHDYTIDLVCHAQVYVFANRYDCEELAMLALQKLALTLSRYDPSSGIDPITTLTAYTYRHTQDHTSGCDRLRTLIIDYLVCHLEKVMKNRRFKLLLQEKGPFADDLLTRAMQRLE